MLCIAHSAQIDGRGRQLVLGRRISIRRTELHMHLVVRTADRPTCGSTGFLFVQVYRAYRQDMDEQKWGVGKYANAPAPSTSADASSAAPATASASGAARAGAAAAAGEPAASGSGAAGDAAPSRSASEGEESGDETGDSDSEDGSEEGEESGSQDSESGSEEHSDDDEDDDASDADTDALSMPAIDSSVMIYTADFPMQNVLLQMGLRLVAKDGRRISRCNVCSCAMRSSLSR